MSGITSVGISVSEKAPLYFYPAAICRYDSCALPDASHSFPVQFSFID